MNDKTKEEVMSLIRNVMAEFLEKINIKAEEKSVIDVAQELDDDLGEIDDVDYVDDVDDVDEEDELEDAAPTNSVSVKPKMAHDDDVCQLKNKAPFSSAPSKSPSKVRKSSQTKEPVKNNKGTQARVLPFEQNPNRPNLFVDMGFDQMCKEDIQIDKKLNAGRTPSPRKRRTTLVEAECTRCGKIYTVSIQLVKRVEGELVFVCDRCIGKH
jgi:hypothetical protein